MKILIIINYIGPIRVFLFNKIYDYLKKHNRNLKVVFLSESDKNRNWKREQGMKFDYTILNNFAIREHGKDLNTFFINLGMIKLLKSENPDKIICFGWDHFAAYAANWWARKNKKEFILWSGSTKYEPSWRRTLFGPLVKYIVKRSHKFLSYGTRSKEYLISLGAPEKNVEIFYNTIDVDFFQEKIRSFTDNQKNELRKKIGIKTTKTILFSGRLIEMKGIFEMIVAFKEYLKKDSNTSLILMGTGPDEEKLKEIIKKDNIKNVFFAGFVQYKELYKYYGISDLLLFPSRQDIWGQVVNEAIACGLPVITTEKVGASADLIENGKNGYIIRENCAECISESIDNVFKKNINKTNNSTQILEKIRVDNILKEITIL
ncbi:MAG: Glycosyl transferase group 1 [Candidatus Moranbacteria bacterium GW2011_GWE2_35_2-]|nr:MAG: Glycosyl transferase group 1 [Candidatus Moranbacteria bacterium GW2011_GWE2_35_2-]KKQ04271.1 MAG: Glycosyl transferase group 1 [Candidatus Moranbacteria bacterium GW2011_GWF1_36_4]KKQ22865.1 MAG: Glycosyl transferase group 1 [Candidatus Moranbacteria bacterium GW2011_GWF2_37_11]KKQ29223.1 MAG: Glycosyl transferase group 1 [Candidatus Moranbacteria bacterium GW2011_GWD1_37_17]KKQ30904.1 MAG: Glycosyl transferase group 1 [Candidatus Moranbacteria bacterium GW2011_GWE1_37_24]KKQ46974.1 M